MKFKTLVVLIFFTIHQVGSLWLWTGYAMGKNYYAGVLCVNKQNTKLKCEGKCALKKQISLSNTAKSNSAEWTFGFELSEFVAHRYLFKDPVLDGFLIGHWPFHDFYIVPSFLEVLTPPPAYSI